MNSRLLIITIIILIGSIAFVFYLQWDSKQFKNEIQTEIVPFADRSLFHHDSENIRENEDTRDDSITIEQEKKTLGNKKETHLHEHPHKHTTVDKTLDKSLPSYTSDDIKKIVDLSNNFVFRMADKYRDVMDVFTLSEEEFNQRYPTEVERSLLEQRFADLEDEMLRESRLLFSNLSDEEYESAISALRGILTKDFDHILIDKEINALRLDLHR